MYAHINFLLLESIEQKNFFTIFLSVLLNIICVMLSVK
ncbi:MAG: hypothetical protein P857_705 [Candidatus Xenolissoclinum pacificiensis L6]|uniref:Uncharacterized protein n=1 Tax=Candidatus Xenolissoclinum pacificiensis L6 TaxID=1401685 RepID=W2UZF2_9RICK|nr:MAG: hypothetical protein P857_705 [Candidatus Xenolissoclinum pacificiensis L6]